MPRITIGLLLTVASGAVHAHVPENQEGLVMQLAHQALGAHHLPLTLLAIVAGLIVYRSWRIAQK